MVTFFISLFAFIFAIGILVVFHEWGHFCIARLFGVKVLRFSVGFGKPLWTYKSKNDVDYVISALPLGGYVKMLDEREVPVPPELQSQAFNRKPVLTRFAIVLAGPVFNFIFAIFAYWLMFMIGITGLIPQIGEVAPSSIAEKAGLKPGAVILAVDEEPTATWQQVFKQLMRRIGDKNSLEIEAKSPDGSHHTYILDLSQWELKGLKPNLLHGLGMEPYHPPIPPIIENTIHGEPAAKGGILPHDEIIAVNGKPITTWKEVTDVVTKNADNTVSLTVKRNGEEKTLTVIPRLKESDTGEKIGFIGLAVKVPKVPPEMKVKEQLPPLAAFKEACIKTKEYTLLTFSMIGKLFTGKVGLESLSGPITIAQGAGASAVVGLPYYLGFLGLISISLGVINLLPIPILDGGHLLFYIIEMVIRRPVSERWQLVGYKIGLLLLIFLILVAFYNDIVRLF